MNKAEILQALDAHRPWDAQAAQHVALTREFVAALRTMPRGR
ncbi:MAG: hypothetical protein AABY83_03920 [Pseudomonadota bacterium]